MAGDPKTLDCVVCRHKHVSAIDAAQEAGDHEIQIAQRFSVTKVALRKHAAHKAAQSASAPKTHPSPPSNVVPLRSCAICRHDRRSEIEAALAAGDVWSKVGRHFLVDAKDVRGHAVHCLKGAFKRIGREDDPNAVANARVRCLALVKQVEELIEQAINDDEASYSDQAKLLSAGQRLIESLGRFTGEIGATVEVNIVESPKWQRIEAAIAQALAPFPEAAAAVVKVLEELETA